MLPVIVRHPLSDPIYIEARQLYLFGGRLAKYVDRMPNNVLGRFKLETNYGTSSSGSLYFFTF